METLSPVYMFAALMVLNMLRWLLLRSKIGFVHQHKTRLALEIASLRREAATYNTPATYVKCAKLQRLANAKEKELASLEEHNDIKLQDKIDAVVATLKLLLIGLAVVAWWGKALLHVPPHLTWPFSRLLAFPHASNYLEVGAVTVLPWVTMCDRVSNLLARVAFPQQLLDLRTQPLSTVQEEPESVLS